jgi:hypothetical protein
VQPMWTEGRVRSRKSKTGRREAAGGALIRGGPQCGTLFLQISKSSWVNRRLLRRNARFRANWAKRFVYLAAARPR